MAGEDLYGALAGLNYDPMQTGYGMSQQALVASAPALMNPYASTGSNLGVALGTALMSGLLGYQARQQAAEDSLMANRLGLQLLQASTPEARLGIIEGAPDSDMQSKLLAVNTRLAAQQALTKALVDQEVAKKTGLAEFDLGPLGTKLYERDLQKARDLVDIRRGGISTGVRAGSGTTLKDAVYGKPVDVTNPETLAGRRDLLIQRGIDLGMTPNQALNYAEKNLAMDTAANKTLSKKLENARDRAANLQEIAATGRAGMEGAGMTGGLLQGPRELASKALSVVSPTEQEKRNSQALLDSVRPRVVQIMRSPGAVTDYETKLLIKAGPSSTNTPGENARILQNMEVISNLESEYADFVEAYMQQSGSAVGADKVWNKYKEEEVFPTGKYNQNRMSVFDFLSDKGSQITDTIKTPAISAQDQKLLDAGFTRGPNGGWIAP